MMQQEEFYWKDKSRIKWLRKEDYSSFSSVHRVYFSFDNFTLPDGAQTSNLEILCSTTMNY
ncbi:hypothetical protein GIB67_036675 [Kingdonia uniflora]|uniref:Uncharacterized protein n=1 Tax=Kingdonia uniflora TaxID=39325 RepID=A0A7J7LWC7_9MAGN|nr:hypothetical protein GIB67_036675 [Kingdonia uniflora]